MYYCTKFQIIPMQVLSFCRANIHTHIPTHSHRDKLIAISALPYYVVGGDNNAQFHSSPHNAHINETQLDAWLSTDQL